MNSSATQGDGANTLDQLPEVGLPFFPQAASTPGWKSPGMRESSASRAAGTSSFHAVDASAPLSLGSFAPATLFSTCTMITVRPLGSRCFTSRISAAKALRSASSTARENADSDSMGLSPISSARGKRCPSRFTHAGT